MSYVNAIDAQQLQSAGVSSEEILGFALERTHLAIVDTARKGGDHVEVTVMRLDDGGFERLQNDLMSRGFVLSNPRVHNPITRSLVISWAQKMQG